jgi:predicted HAD superfamily phosphohydrolase YqeG
LVIKDMELFKPDFHCNKITDIPFETLRIMYDIKYLILDYHGTLIKWPAGKMPSEYREYLKKARSLEWIEGIALAPNMGPACLSLPNFLIGIEDAISKLSADLECYLYMLYGKDQKPHSAGIQRILESEKWDPKNTLYIGDQLNDIKAAHLAGCKGLLITKHLGIDPPWIFYKRIFKERTIKKKLKLTF